VRLGGDRAYLAGGVEHHHVPGDRVGPPPAEGSIAEKIITRVRVRPKFEAAL
jgi:hypothetical protein